jgi:N-methylhydantoinase B
MFPDDVAEIAARGGLIPHAPDAYAKSTPVAGVLDPTTKAPDPNGEFFYFAAQNPWRTRAGAMFRYINNGGGGWGDPYSREPERVLRDVRDGYVSLDGARDDYGVVVLGDPHGDPEGLSVDAAATAELRGRHGGA